MKRLLVFFLATICLASCSKVTTSNSAANTREPWTIPGVVRLGESEEPDSLNPFFSHDAAADGVQALLFSYLLRYDANGNYIPDIATRVPSLANGDISRDGRSITVHLRHHVLWADGVPLTARDWMFTYHAVLNPRNNIKSTFGWDDIASANAPNPFTLVIHLKHASASFLGTLAMGGYPPFPAHLLARLPDLNHAGFNTHPLSSGPYLLQAWHHGSELIFTPNPRYFRGKPKLRRLEWKIIPNANTLFQALQTHEIDIYPSVAANQVARLAQIPGIVVRKKLVANIRGLGIQMARPLLRDVRVRRAIALGIDWHRIDSSVYRDLVTPATSDIFPQSWAAPNIPPYRFDPGRARALLRAAGWHRGVDGIRVRNGVRLALQVISGVNQPENEDSEVLMQSMLRNIGIALSIRNYPPSLLFAQNGPIYTGHYDLEWSIETLGPDPDNSGDWNSAFIPPKGANTSWLRDPLIDTLSSQAAATYNLARRKLLYQREQERLHQLVPEVFAFWENSYDGVSRDVHGYRPAAYIADTWNAWQWSI